MNVYWYVAIFTGDLTSGPVESSLPARGSTEMSITDVLIKEFRG